MFYSLIFGLITEKTTTLHRSLVNTADLSGKLIINRVEAKRATVHKSELYASVLPLPFSKRFRDSIGLPGAYANRDIYP